MKSPRVLEQFVDTGHSRCRRAGVVLALSFLLAAFMGGCGVTTERVSGEPSVGPSRAYYGRLWLFDEVYELLIGQSDLREPGVRERLVRAMGRTEDPAAYSVLVRILLDGEPPQLGDVRSGEWHEAAHALARLGDPRALDVLREAMAAGRLTRHDGLRAIAGLAASGENTEALDYVVRVLESDQDEEVRSTVALALYGAWPKQVRAMPALHRIAHADASMRMRVAVACLLASDGDKTYWPFLKDAAADQDFTVREEVARDLPFRDEAIPLLLKLLTDDNMDVVGAAWDRLESHLGCGTSPPHDVESARIVAEEYRKAWDESRHK